MRVTVLRSKIPAFLFVTPHPLVTNYQCFKKSSCHWNVSNYLSEGSTQLLQPEDGGTIILQNICINLQVNTSVKTEKTCIFRMNNIYKILLAGFATQNGRKLTLFAVSNCFYPSSFVNDFWLVDSIIMIEVGVHILHGIKCTVFNTMNETFILCILSKLCYSGNMFWPNLVTFRPSWSYKVKICDCIQYVE